MLNFKTVSEKNGITLIALVITIIVLLILAEISITMISGNNGTIKQAIKAKEMTEKTQEEELINMAVVSAKAEKYTGTESNELENNIKASFGENAKVDVVDDEITGEEGYIIKLPNGNVYPIGIKNEVMDVYVPENDQSGNFDIKVIGYNIALNGKIGLIFYFTIPEEKINSGTETIKLIADGNEEKTQIINVNKNTISRTIINEEKCYYVEAWMPAKEMVDTVKFCAYSNNVQDSKEYNYSIKECGDELISIVETDATNKKQELAYYIKTMLYYGGMAQSYFDYKTSNLASEGIEVDTSFVNNDYLNDYVSVKTGETTASYSVLGITCMFKENYTVRIRYNFPNEDINNYNAYIDNKKTNFLKDNVERYYVEFEPVSLDKANIFHEVVIKDNDGNICGQKMKVCVLTYFRASLRGSNTVNKNLAKSFVAMYNAYNQFVGN